MEKLGNLIKIRLNKHSIGQAAHSSEVVYFANQLLKSEIESESGDVSANKFIDGVLTVKVKGAALSQEVWGSQKSILAGLQKRFGENTVKKITIKSV
jgi:hypothetical protein